MEERERGELSGLRSLSFFFNMEKKKEERERERKEF